MAGPPPHPATPRHAARRHSQTIGHSWCGVSRKLLLHSYHHHGPARPPTKTKAHEAVGMASSGGRFRSWRRRGAPRIRRLRNGDGVSTTSLVYFHLCGKARPFARGSLPSNQLQGGVSAGPELSLRGRRESAPLCSRRMLRSLNPRAPVPCINKWSARAPVPPQGGPAGNTHSTRMG